MALGSRNRETERMIERRIKRRIPFERDCRIRLMQPNLRLDALSSRTINMSSNGILIRTACRWDTGTPLEVAIHWPTQLNEQCRLKLVARARVIRCDGDQVACAIEGYEFRTLGNSGLV
jgi:hypothetical protein